MTKEIEKNPYKVGSKYLIRTVTMIYTGKLVKVYSGELVIVNACWIAETERWAQSVAKGIFREQEPYPWESEVIISRAAVLDIVEVKWDLPRDQK